jgi:hypothetical protein
MLGGSGCVWCVLGDCIALASACLLLCWRHSGAAILVLSAHYHYSIDHSGAAMCAMLAHGLHAPCVCGIWKCACMVSDTSNLDGALCSV